METKKLSDLEKELKVGEKLEFKGAFNNPEPSDFYVKVGKDLYVKVKLDEYLLIGKDFYDGQGK